VVHGLLVHPLHQMLFEFVPRLSFQPARPAAESPLLWVQHNRDVAIWLQLFFVQFQRNIRCSNQTFLFLKVSMLTRGTRTCQVRLNPLPIGEILLTDATPEVELLADVGFVPVGREIETTAHGW